MKRQTALARHAFNSSSPSCSSSSSTYSSSSTLVTPRAARLARRRVLQVSGPDAPKFLKGLLCKDVDALGGGYTGFLNASGRVLHTSFVVPVQGSSPPTYLVSHQSQSTADNDEDDHPAPLEKFLPPFRLRSKVRITDVSSAWEVWSAWGGSSSHHGAGTASAGPSETWRMGSGGASERVWRWDSVGGCAPLGLSEGEHGCWDLRAGWGSAGLGRQVFVPSGARPSVLDDHDEVDEAQYDLRRMLLGVPEGPREIVPAQALPLESCMDVHGGVDFRKGCYLGQELTVRTYHTGATRKRILPIRLFALSDRNLPLASALASASTPSGPTTTAGAIDNGDGDITYTPPMTAASKKPRSAGKILSLHPTVTNLGLGLVRLEMAERSWWDVDGGGVGGGVDGGKGASVGDGVDLLGGTVGDYLSGARGRLCTTIRGETWGVHVGVGEAYGAALAYIQRESEAAAEAALEAAEATSV